MRYTAYMAGKTPNRTLKVLPYIISEYKKGVNGRAIAKKLSLHPSVVYYQLKKNNVCIRTKSEVKLSSSNPMWAGNKVQYTALHNWVKKRLPKPDTCPRCGVNPALDLANVSNKYNKKTYNRNLSNWKWLCRKCHMIEDGRINNLKRGEMVARTFGCLAKNCNNKHYAKNYCHNHYELMRYHNAG